MDKISAESPNSANYFRLLSELLFKCKAGTQFWRNLFDKIISLLRNHPALEVLRLHLIPTNFKKMYETSPEDQTLIGLINLLSTIIAVHPVTQTEDDAKTLIDEIYFQYLFDTPNVNRHGKRSPPKCKTRYSRNSALNLLRQYSVTSLELFTHIRELIRGTYVQLHFDSYFL